MQEKADHNALTAEIERENFVRAVVLAEHMALPKEEIEDLRRKALGQIAAIYRNPHGMKGLARQNGYSRDDVKQILKQYAHKMKTEGNTKPLDPCYDYHTGNYLSFEEWMDYYLRRWDKIGL